MQESSNSTTGRICPRGANQYIWRAGDTLQGVAGRNGITTQSVVLFNPDVDFDTITPGETICVPPTPLSCIGGTLYAVEVGDTLQSIAEGFGVSTLALQERNPNVDAGNLLVGEVLCIPRSLSDDTADDDSNSGSGSTDTDTGGNTGFSCPLGYYAKSVREGQTYADLLVENNVSYRALRTTNPQLRPGRLTVGTLYCAPPSGTRQTCGSAGEQYTILPDETIDTLAEKFSTTRGRLLMLNPTFVPSDFSSGTIICVP